MLLVARISFADENCISPVGKGEWYDEMVRPLKCGFHQPDAKVQHYYFSGGYMLAIFA